MGFEQAVLTNVQFPKFSRKQDYGDTAGMSRPDQLKADIAALQTRFEGSVTLWFSYTLDQCNTSSAALDVPAVTLGMNDLLVTADRLDEAAALIAKAERVFMIGIGNSGSIAEYGARYFSSMGKFCLYIDEPHYPTESRFVENSLVIVFSVSGESHDTIGHVLRFKEQNCQILSVTNTENCTIAKLSDYNLAYYVTYERLGAYDVTSQLPAMSIVERLGKKLYRYTSEGPAAI